MKNETSITKSFSTIDEQYTITQCSNGYILEINGRDRKDDYLNIKHLLLKHEELVDVLIAGVRQLAAVFANFGFENAFKSMG